LQHGDSSTQHEPVGQHDDRAAVLLDLVIANPAQPKLPKAKTAARIFPIMNQSPRGFRASGSAVTATTESDSDALPNRNEESLAAQSMMQIEKVGRIPKRPVAGHTGQVRL